jgi:Zn finger protein HypA/HybF involved in hydrogenase expression
MLITFVSLPIRGIMGLFKKLGRQAEQFKQDMQAAAAEETAAEETAAEQPTTYHCEACDARFTDHREQCPECNAADIVALQQYE